jgi:Tol biopolymer transport system component
VWLALWLLAGCVITQAGTSQSPDRSQSEILPTATALPLPIYATNTRAPEVETVPPILFESNRDGTYELYAINPDGTGLRQITDFEAEADISSGSPVWSPDGSQFAFSSRRAGDWDIHVNSIDGSFTSNLTAIAGEDDKASWSPDGMWFVFNSRRNEARWADIWLMGADGSDPINLTDHPDDDREPAFSPNGMEIAFRSFRDGNYDIYVMDIETRASHQLTTTEDPAWNSLPTWSPDGSRIAFETNRNGNWDVYVMDNNGYNLRNLTPDAADDKEPAWSPDGSRIAFSSDRDGNSEIYILEIATGEITRLTYDCGGDFNPDWRRVGAEDGNAEPPDTAVAYVARSAPINLRTGPGTTFDSVRGAVLNECLTVIGRNIDGAWLHVRTSRGDSAWAALSLVDVQGDLSNVPTRSE